MQDAFVRVLGRFHDLRNRDAFWWYLRRTIVNLSTSYFRRRGVERAWLARYIADPAQMLSSGDPVATALHNKYKKVGMPYLGLSASQVAEVISFLDARDSAVARGTQKESARAH